MSCCKSRDPEAVCEVGERARRMIHKQVNFSAHVFLHDSRSFYGFMNVKQTRDRSRSTTKFFFSARCIP